MDTRNVAQQNASSLRQADRMAALKIHPILAVAKLREGFFKYFQGWK